MNIFSCSCFTRVAILLGVVIISSCEQVDLDGELTDVKAGFQNSSVGDIDYNVSLRSAEFLIQSTEGSKEIKSIEPLVYEGDTLMFIFNFEDGWQVISGDKRTEPFIASD
ncbi:MAG: hypothetical protein MI866_18390, partial [Bacteroidales bacterium]|nr:hypothetical protein [Bacteroidales bacterium]